MSTEKPCACPYAIERVTCNQTAIYCLGMHMGPCQFISERYEVNQQLPLHRQPVRVGGAS